MPQQPAMATIDFSAASGRTSAKMNLPTLQSKMKQDPEGYSSELSLIYNQFKSGLELFKQQAALNFTSLSGVGGVDTTVAKNLSDRITFLAQVTPFYRKELAQFPNDLIEFLNSSSARNLPSGLRLHAAQALILLINRKIIDIADTVAVFMDFQTMGDRELKKLAFSHVIHSIRRMNQKHKNDPQNKGLQNIMFGLLQQEEEAKAKRALITLCDLYRRKVWFDDRTANAISTACFHSSSTIMVAALSFLLDFEKIEDDDDDSEEEDDQIIQQPQVVLSKEAIYKANNKGTTSSKKKKKAKLQRIARSMKKQQRLSSERSNSNYYCSPLNHLKDAQGFVEKLFSRLQSGSNERFEVKMMILKVIARTIGLHKLILLKFYPFLQKYVQPHQRDVTSLLAAAVQACHDMIPPDAVEPLFKQIVNQFVHDRSRPEAISVGLNAVREICLRMPLLMTEDLLQDLVLYKKSHEKAVSSAARSLLTLFREVCPSLLIKKDRGRPVDPKARPKAFGEVHVASSIPGVELLEHESDDASSDDEGDEDKDKDATIEEDGSDESSEHYESGDSAQETDDDSEEEEEEEAEDSDNCDSDMEEEEEEDDDDEEIEPQLPESDNDNNTKDTDANGEKSSGKKRKYSDFEGQLNAASKSLRALKKLARPAVNVVDEDGILSNEDFQRIKELKAKKEARAALTHHGFKIPSSDQLSSRRVDAAKLEANIKTKLSKEEKLQLIRAGREERGKYQARTALKKKKTGGLSNRQKESKKVMPLAAKRSKRAKSRQEKKKLRQRSGKQFRGRKAWK
ncbi:uncharacterized protein LOC127245780 [Andrographis paniculata]|uniref:uncharacterized protein LOC127245780 n=1 Tax=Andrographis paniculata TaxID=175694 RepID=UPI0021E94448|nr:uncharacterized protein LOC127245780 [Andrographis paniculata]